ncbi:rod shape-determining protein RodA [Aliikangiella coralliicola]|uniref:Peptidoglycan glycosyltransferase MrdB n=1 Tax=Aliikangiella coralliicola TaxID=2592383 RepID=A0A545U7K0_9GAMM|nr:rod shape-determining protein RodA [Aliikangiella coralliicola]TQV85444.1 rod shape-determining protein RodA [Aliikangiella coralliicola]
MALIDYDNSDRRGKSLPQQLHLDLPLLAGLLVLIGFGLIVLYSASGESQAQLNRQVVRLAIAFVAMIFLAWIPPRVYQKWTPFIFAAGVLLLVAVIFVGDKGKGAQRWLEFGVIRFQPSEIMKLAVPMMLAWYFSERALPPNVKELLVAAVLIAVPTLLIMIQPDLGTSILIASSGVFVIFLAGISWRWIGSLAALALIYAPIHWFFVMQDYQKQRVFTYLDPEKDPLGSGYHIIQSQIAIGSGGLRGKGWLEGTQSQLEFLPERNTDFIFAVLGEEFGFLGIVMLLAVYLAIIGRGFFIAVKAQDTFTRLLAGAITLTFFVYVFVNIGMVTGVLPVVGLPLPLVSYGGTSMVTLMASFGILMGIQTHKKLLPG